MLVKIEKLNKEEILVVSSRTVAEDFEKEHYNVTRDIENLLKEIPSKLTVLTIEILNKLRVKCLTLNG